MLALGTRELKTKSVTSGKSNPLQENPPSGRERKRTPRKSSWRKADRFVSKEKVSSEK